MGWQVVDFIRFRATNRRTSSTEVRKLQIRRHITSRWSLLLEVSGAREATSSTPEPNKARAGLFICLPIYLYTHNMCPAMPQYNYPKPNRPAASPQVVGGGGGVGHGRAFHSGPLRFKDWSF